MGQAGMQRPFFDVLLWQCIKTYIAAACVNAYAQAQRGTTAFQLGHGGRGHGVHHRQHCLRVLQAVLQGFRAKQLRQRHDHGAHLPNRHVGHHGLETLG